MKTVGQYSINFLKIANVDLKTVDELTRNRIYTIASFTLC